MKIFRSLNLSKRQIISNMALWKIFCMEGDYPGLWQRWFINQCVTVGWKASWGFTMDGPTKDRGWSLARGALRAIKKGDLVIVALRGNRVARVGQVVDINVSDEEWAPLVPASRNLIDGEMGRRIQVRWDLTIGPESRDMVVLLPHNKRFNSGEIRRTLCQIKSIKAEDLIKQMKEPENWVGLASHFDYEKALSGFIATFPHHLEDGLQAHPDKKLRENTFIDGTRADVLLIDREERPVVVECKQGTPTLENLNQLSRYMEHIDRENADAGLSAKSSRGILVHGGSSNLTEVVRKKLAKTPNIQILSYRLAVDFKPCG